MDFLFRIVFAFVIANSTFLDHTSNIDQNQRDKGFIMAELIFVVAAVLLGAAFIYGSFKLAEE
ncbi:hypothetical protein [Nitratifractor sp.]